MRARGMDLVIRASGAAPGREGLPGAEEGAAGKGGVEARGGERRRHGRLAGAMGNRIPLGFWREMVAGPGGDRVWLVRAHLLLPPQF